MQEQEEYKVFYKIMGGNKYRIFKTTFNEKDYYKIQVSQKNYDNTVSKFYKQVVFKKGVNIDNETDIIIKKAFENLRENPNDKYNPISSLMITDFEIVERQEKIEQDAYAEFQENLNEQDLIDIDDSFLD